MRSKETEHDQKLMQKILIVHLLEYYNKKEGFGLKTQNTKPKSMLTFRMIFLSYLNPKHKKDSKLTKMRNMEHGKDRGYQS